MKGRLVLSPREREFMLDILNTYFPVRYTVMVLSALGLLLSLAGFALTGAHSV
jgi:hypothetical protein